MGKRVLLVQAAAGGASVHQVRLANAGYTVKLVTSAAATPSAVKAFGPDLVVLDMDLVERSEVDVTSWLQSAAPTPMLLLVPCNAVIRAGESATPVDYLAKPFTAAALLEGVQMRLNRANL